VEGGRGRSERGAHRRNSNDTKPSSVSINMFAGTKIKTIGAPTMWDFTNVLGSKLAYNTDNHVSSNRTLHIQHGKVLRLYLRSNISNFFFLHVAKPHFYYTTRRVNDVSGNTGH
jgi:hypothetical protein